MVELYSFDIFDTLITRKVAKPVGIFALMQHVISTESLYEDLPYDVITNFYKYRINAEYRLRRFNHLWKNKQEITFEEIYNDIEETYGLSKEQSIRLKNLELEIELDNILPIEKNILKEMFR